MSNRPLNYIDPSGHCQGNYDTATATATDDQACWDFLSNEFCSGGKVAICDRWFERLFPNLMGCTGESCLISFGENFWSASELRALRDAVGDVITALDGAGHDGREILEGITFERTHGVGYSITFPKSHISLDDVNPQTIWHEIGHAISFRNGRTPQDTYYDFAEGFAATKWYEMEDFCYRAYCETEYSRWQRLYTGEHPEYWADGFSGWVNWHSNGQGPSASSGYTPNWTAIRRAVEWSLVVTFNQ